MIEVLIIFKSNFLGSSRDWNLFTHHYITFETKFKSIEFLLKLI